MFIGVQQIGLILLNIKRIWPRVVRDDAALLNAIANKHSCIYISWRSTAGLLGLLYPSGTLAV